MGNNSNNYNLSSSLFVTPALPVFLKSQQQQQQKKEIIELFLGSSFVCFLFVLVPHFINITCTHTHTHTHTIGVKRNACVCCASAAEKCETV